MTVINTTDTIREVGNGVKVAFTFPFKIFLTSDLDVFKIDTDVAPEVATLQVEGVDYTVAINTVTEGGTVTYTVAPTTSPQEDSFIGRNLNLNQLTDIPREANFPEESIAANACELAKFPSSSNLAPRGSLKTGSMNAPLN